MQHIIWRKKSYGEKYRTICKSYNKLFGEKNPMSKFMELYGNNTTNCSEKKIV